MYILYHARPCTYSFVYQYSNKLGVYILQLINSQLYAYQKKSLECMHIIPNT